MRSGFRPELVLLTVLLGLVAPGGASADCHHGVGGEIRRTIRRQMNRFVACYEAELGRQPWLRGRTVTELVIDADGGVFETKLAESTLANARMESCVLDVFRGLEFPARMDEGRRVLVRYPLVFALAEAAEHVTVPIPASAP